MNAPVRLRNRASTVLLAMLVVGLGAVVLVTPAPAVAASKCTALTKSVRLFVDAKRSVNVLTYNAKRFAGLKKSGYADTGVIFKASNKKKGLTAVHVMYDKRNGDRIYSTSKSEIKSLKKKGYADNGTGFYAYTKSASCLAPVYRLHKGRLHRFAATAGDRSALRKQGWIEETKVFYVGSPRSTIKTTAPKPPPKRPTTKPTPPKPRPAGETVFTIAVMPDTQMEVLKTSDPRFANRTTWLAENKSKLNLKFVTHVGDIVNWDTYDHGQYVIAASALKVLNNNNIPYALVPGNHDTAAVCPGGDACDPARSPQLIRDTRSYNAYLDGGVAALGGRFEAGKVDNTYSTFTAGQRKWLVLNLEVYPRIAVVNWAKSVVASHPTHNVMVVTHSYLTGSGGIGTRHEYGPTTPKYLYDNLVSRYANVRFVFSGHVGKSAHRVDTGLHKNRIDSFLLTMHDKKTNPVRMVQIDTWQNSLRTWVYAPYTNQNYPGYTVSLSKLSFVR